MDIDKLCEVMFQTGLMVGQNPWKDVEQSMSMVDSQYSQDLTDEER